MYGERWDEHEMQPSLPPTEPTRGRVFGARGRGFLHGREKELPRSFAGNGQGRSNGSEKCSDSESPNSGSSNLFRNQNASGRSKDHHPRDTSGYEDSPQEWTNKTSNASKYSDGEEENGGSPYKGNPRKSNASKYSDGEEENGGSPYRGNPRKSNASKYSDGEEENGGSPCRGNPQKSNASKYSDGEEGNGGSPYRGNPRKSNASKYSDGEEGNGDSPYRGNPRKSNASKYSDGEEENGGSPYRRNPRKSNASKYSDGEERNGGSPYRRNPRKSNASKYSDGEEEYGGSSYRGNPRKSNASKYSDGEEGNGGSPYRRNPRKSNASKYSDGEEEYGGSSYRRNPRKSNASKYSDDEAERYEDSPQDTSSSDQKENMPVRRKEGRNDNGWNKENLWKDDRRGKQQKQEQQPPKKPYIPNPDPENDEELFRQNIASGINFDRYDDIQVTVTGENIPQKIEQFDEAQICDLVMENINRSSYVKPTPVQKYALPIIMDGRDLMACAQTGSGKTAAFLIPTINCMLESGDVSPAGHWTASPQLLIITPTRELALQIYVEAKKLTYGSDLKTEICYGGTDLRHQLNKIQKGCNILIATCGRLIDFLNRGAVTLKRLRHLIIDEADKMLDRGFFDDIETIIKHKTAPKEDKRQILMFSATFPDEVQDLARIYLKEYIFIAVGIIGAACQDVEQKFFLVYKPDKKDRLINLLDKELSRSKTLVFVQHKRVADIIAAKLSEIGFPATSMHGDREQKQREEALRDFRVGKANILVATAVAARGLDIRGISYVINYDLPQTVDEYVHRIGRTGRVGNRGLAISFYDPDYDSSLVPGISRILVQAHQNIPSFF